ncbi:hypothetical protein GC207_15120 [bacterium]|nr:hypothetical protein [bacterium]
MKPKRLNLGVLIAGLTIIFAALIWRTSHVGIVTTDLRPPIERLRPFSFAAAPSAPGKAIWSTNVPGTPQQAAAIRTAVGSILAASSKSGPPTVLGAGGAVRDSKQVAALKRLQSKVGASLQVYLRSQNSTPNQLKGHPLATPVGTQDNEATAQSFFKQNADLLLINRPDQELKLAQRQPDPLGGAELRFTQHYRGQTVWPAEIGVHFDAGGNIDLVDAAYIPTPEGLNVQPKIAADAAMQAARQSVKTDTVAKVGTPELLIYGPLDQPARLAWKMDVSVSLTQDWWVLIDAQSGEHLTSISRVMQESVNGSGTDLFGATVPLHVWQENGTYYLIDASKPMFNTNTGTGFIEIDDAANQTKDQILPNNVLQNISFTTSASTNSWSNPDGVSAAYNMAQTYDYYQDRFGRSSYNGAGSNILAVVRIDGLANAFWVDALKRMLFGNADLYAGSLDVIGHEVTHGVVSSQGALLYQNQPGALNEAFADIFGEMIETRTSGTNDWLIGSQLMNPVRNMASPSDYGQPSKMSDYIVTTVDAGGVHENSGIIDHAYYMLAAGLNGAIGNQDAEQIFYRCLTISMRPQSQFIDARLGCVAAAEALFGVGSQQALKTAEAFDVVELYAAPASAPQPASVNAAVAAADSAMFVRHHWFFNRDDLFRLESAQGDSSTGTSLITSVAVRPPAVTGNGEGMFFVGADEGLYGEKTDGTGFTNLVAPGTIHSLTVSPNGRYVAFVPNSQPGLPTNQIVLIDTANYLFATVDLVTPVSDGPPINNISYADSLSFSPDGQRLIYDAVSRLRGPDGNLRQAWSIFGLDVATGEQHVVVPPEDQFDLGNPSFSHTSSRYIVFDARYTNGNSAIVTLDFDQGSLGLIGVSQNGVGYPVFNGDDSVVYFADEDTSTYSGRSVYAQSITADKLAPVGDPALAIGDAKLAVIYRRGTYPDINTAPTVTLTSPTPDSEFTSPANVTLAASANDLDGNVVRVEFYGGNQLLFSDTSAPYEFNWPDLPAGVYSVYARVYDDHGASAMTGPVRFTVKPASEIGVFSRAGTPGFELNLKLPTTGLFRLEASTNLVDWVSLGSFYCSTNLGFLDSAATNYPQRFYRAIAVR